MIPNQTVQTSSLNTREADLHKVLTITRDWFYGIDFHKVYVHWKKIIHTGFQKVFTTALTHVRRLSANVSSSRDKSSATTSDENASS